MARHPRSIKVRRRRPIWLGLLGILILALYQYVEYGRLPEPERLVDEVVRVVSDQVNPPEVSPTSSSEYRKAPPPQIHTRLTGQVIRVTDGDTLTIGLNDATRHTIRLHGIDAPERDQPYGQIATRALTGAVHGRTVTIEVKDIDDYGRVVGRVMLDERDINVDLVSDGHAWWYRQYAKNDEALAVAEAQAQSEKRGLWDADKPVPPWIWRRR